ncbi:MAG: hypothetical protein KDD70_13735 [Bdellovibrionales bacterium]|nr:hypothetical protein [Bdellovibrionales bacterium]
MSLGNPLEPKSHEFQSQVSDDKVTREADDSLLSRRRFNRVAILALLGALGAESVLRQEASPQVDDAVPLPEAPVASKEVIPHFGEPNAQRFLFSSRPPASFPSFDTGNFPALFKEPSLLEISNPLRLEMGELFGVMFPHEELRLPLLQLVFNNRGTILPPESLIPYLEVSDPRVVSYALALGVEKGIISREFQSFENLLASGNPDIQLQTLKCIQAVGCRVPRERILPFVANSDERLATVAIDVLATVEETTPFSLIEIGLHHSSPSVQAKIVRFLADKTVTDMPVDILTRLEKPLQAARHCDVIFEDAVLHLIEKRAPAGTEDFLVRNYLETPNNSSHLSTALELVKAREQLLDRVSYVDLVRLAQELSENNVKSGNELRVGWMLEQKLMRESDGIEVVRNSGEIGMPLLHFLEHVTQRFPTLLRDLDCQPQALGRFVVVAAQFICEERDGQKRRAQTELTEEVNLLIALHAEPYFRVDEMRARASEIAGQAQLNLIGVYKSADGGKSEQIVEVGPAFVAKNYSPISGDLKGRYLRAVTLAAQDTQRESIIWNSGHGSPNAFWFQNGQSGLDSVGKVDGAEKVLAAELADALLRPALEKSELRDVTQNREIELSHVTIINDACYQYEFIYAVYDRLFAQAKENSCTVRSLPVMVSASQEGLPGWLWTRNEEDGPGSFLEKAVGSMDMSLYPTSLERIIAADRSLSEKFQRLLTERQSRLCAEDLAIFSPRVVDLDQIVEGLLFQVQQCGYLVPPLPDPAERGALQAGQQRTIQIAMNEREREQLEKFV